MNKGFDDLIDKLAKSARNRIFLTFLLSIPPILLTGIFFPEKLKDVLAILELAWGLNIGIFVGILIVDLKIKKAQEQKQEEIQ